MDLIYIILISIAVVSFITGFVISTIQKKNSTNELVNGLENSGNLEASNLEKTLNLTTTLKVNDENNEKKVTNEPVIISSVVLDFYDEEIL